jgi:hypothetical protein
MFRVVRTAPHWVHSNTDVVSPGVVQSRRGSVDGDVESHGGAHPAPPALSRGNSAIALEGHTAGAGARAVDAGGGGADDAGLVSAPHSESSGLIAAPGRHGPGGRPGLVFRSTGTILQETKSNWLLERLPFDLTPSRAEAAPRKARHVSTRLTAIPVDLAPFQVSELTTTAMLHYLFAVCMWGRMYVTAQGGRLVGVLFKNDFLKAKVPTEGFARAY